MKLTLFCSANATTKQQLTIALLLLSCISAAEAENSSFRSQSSAASVVVSQSKPSTREKLAAYKSRRQIEYVSTTTSSPEQLALQLSRSKNYCPTRLTIDTDLDLEFEDFPADYQTSPQNSQESTTTTTTVASANHSITSSLQHISRKTCSNNKKGRIASRGLVQFDQSKNKTVFHSKIVGIFACTNENTSENSKQASEGDLTLDYRLAKPAIELAIEKARARYTDVKLSVAYRAAPDICKKQQAAGHVADEYYRNGASFIVGPGCSEPLESVGRLASFWNIPICSTGYLPELVSSANQPQTLIQLSLSVQSVGEMLIELFKQNKWRHLVILTDDKHPLHTAIRDGLLEFFDTLYNLRVTGHHAQTMHSESDSHDTHKTTSRQQTDRNKRVKYREVHYINVTAKNFAVSMPEVFPQVLLEAAAHSRIMLILARSATIIALLRAAHTQNMTCDKFVFIAHELFEAQMVEQHPHGSNSGNSKFSVSDRILTKLGSSVSSDLNIDNKASALQQVAKEIYSPLLTISLRLPISDEFDLFRDRIANKSQSQFAYTLSPSDLRSRYSLGLAAFIYDCVLLYASKVQQVLDEGKHKRITGSLIFDLSANTTFEQGLSGNLTINLAGQRVIDFTLNDYSPTSLLLEPIAHFSAIERRLTYLPNKAPHWVLHNKSAPLSNPRCKIDSIDAFCRNNDEEYTQTQLQSDVSISIWLAVLVALCVACSSAAVAWLVFYKFRIESELLNLWWSIKYEDILFEDEQVLDGKRSMSSLAISSESFACVNASNNGPACGRSSPSSAQQHHQQRPHTTSPTPNSSHLQVVSPQSLSAAQSTSSLTVAITTAIADVDKATSQNLNENEIYPPKGNLESSSTIKVPSNQQTEFQLRQSEVQINEASLKPAKQVCKLSPNMTGGGLLHFGSPKQQSCAGSGNGTGIGSNRRDPSISSQNKNNAKLKLGTILNANCASSSTHPTKVGLYKANRVAVKHLNVRNLNINRQLLIELRQVRDLTHENLIKFIGLCPDEPNVSIVSELCSRGNLQDLLQNKTIRLDWTFRYSIINDVVEGLAHLHSSPVQYHGRLKSSNCVIDNRFVVKLTDFGLPTLVQAQESESATEENQEKIAENCRLLLWTAPEHLRTKYPLASGSQRGDIYSLAIIFQEIITRCGPFECEPIIVNPHPIHDEFNLRQQQQQHSRKPNQSTNLARQINHPLGQFYGGAAFTNPIIQTPVVVQHKQRLEAEEIVNLVRMGLSPPFRPYFRPDLATVGNIGLQSSTGGVMNQGTVNKNDAANEFNVPELIKLVQTCWQENPSSRPTIANVKTQIKRVRRNQFGNAGGSANLMDNLLQRMERYTDNLESLVEQKTSELMEEKKRSEELLYEMLPRFVVDQLKYGHSVIPEAYESVTVCFSDIKDFTSIAAQSSPIEVVNLLNHLYTEFDDCIAQYDVYKVETIGDSYMVVSGLPIRNGDLHAKEVSEMSLALLDLIRNFRIPHLPHVGLQLRIGIHSGPCASGVVGTKMFRYCLFGDTVNTASRMESHGEPMKIHISEETAAILARFGDTFQVESRGRVDIKGKGLMNTFWLISRSDK